MGTGLCSRSRIGSTRDPCTMGNSTITSTEPFVTPKRWHRYHGKSYGDEHHEVLLHVSPVLWRPVTNDGADGGSDPRNIASSVRFRRRVNRLKRVQRVTGPADRADPANDFDE
jgi:hypothetical protein